MTPVQYPDLNGHRYSWVSIEFNLVGDVTYGLKSLNYSDSCEPGEVKGASPFALGRTRGTYKAEGDGEMFKEEWDNLTDRIAPVGSPFGYGEIPIDAVINYEELWGGAPRVLTDQIWGIRLKKQAASNSEGTDNSIVKFDMSIIVPICWNGKYLMSQR